MVCLMAAILTPRCLTRESVMLQGAVKLEDAVAALVHSEGQRLSAAHRLEEGWCGRRYLDLRLRDDSVVGRPSSGNAVIIDFRCAVLVMLDDGPVHMSCDHDI